MTPATAVPEAPTEQSTAARVRLCAYALIALQLVVRGFVTFPAYFFQDDFSHLDMARRLGLSSDYLFRDYGGHLETGQYLVIWLVSHVIHVSFWPAALSILLLQLWASLLLFWVLRELFGPTPLTLLPLAIYLFTPLSLAWGTWWSAALQSLSLQVSMLTVLLCVARLYRTGERRWAVWSVVAHVLGLLFWEKAALILPTALAVTVLLLSPSRGWRGALHTLRAHWRLWAVHVAVLAAYVVMYLVRVGLPIDRSGETGQSFAAKALQMLDQTLLRMYVPGIFGGPWHADGAENTLFPYPTPLAAFISWALLAAVVVASFAVNGRRALKGWVLLAGYLAVDLELLASGRAEWLGLLARDPRYVADSLPIAAIALVAAFHRPAGSEPRGRAGAVMRQHTTVATMMRVAAVVVASCLLTTSKLAAVAEHEYSYNFSMGVLRQMSEHPERSVVSTAAPFVVSARADVAAMMHAIDADLEFDRPATEMYVFDGLANMRRMALLAGERVHRGPDEGCGWPVGPEWTQVGPIPASDDPVRVLRLGYYSTRSVEVSVHVGEQVQSVRVPAALGHVYFVIASAEGPLAVKATGSADSCITDWAAGTPWVAE